MAENRYACTPGCGNNNRETVCIDTNRVLDSCRDRDCFENVRVYLSGYGNEVLEHTGAIRARSANILWTYIGVDPIQFNRGFYAVTIRFYVKLLFEACVGGGHAQELEGIAVLEKRVILYGGESNVSIFKSSGTLDDGFCGCQAPICGEKATPGVTVEVVDPVILGTRIVERESECNCCCCCCEKDLPQPVLEGLSAPLCFDNGGYDQNGRRYLSVTLGIFSIVRILRPAQYLVQAVECCIPEKECAAVEEDDPCRVFHSMPFPIGEFCTPCMQPPAQQERVGRCGCGS